MTTKIRLTVTGCATMRSHRDQWLHDAEHALTAALRRRRADSAPLAVHWVGTWCRDNMMGGGASGRKWIDDLDENSGGARAPL